MSKLKRNWKVYLVHHTHSDIGYTHTQQEVIDIQMSHMDNALKLIDKTKDNANHEVFHWSPEVTWIVEEWLKIASEEDKQKFSEYVKRGYIGLDAFYANLLTGLCRSEEIESNFRVKKELEELTGTKIDSAMITDIPGWNWGIVESLSKNGVKYLSLGTNHSDRIGHIIEQFGDKPFYWQSKNKEHKVLSLVHGKGYAWFHTGMKATKNLSRKLTPKRIEKYLASLEKADYPYDIAIIRYTIGQDNGPTDENLVSIVKDWNKNYENMQLHISTTSEAFKVFEEKYKGSIPTLCGEISPYWEDGAMSTSKETSMARNAGEKLALVEKAANVFGVELDKNKIDLAWKNTLFFNEHTWGAYNSISRPEHHFAKSQWAWKQKYAVNAKKESESLYLDLVSSLDNKKDVTIYNPHDWDISRLVRVKTSLCGVENNSKEVASQKMSNGEIVFVCNVKAKSSEEYTFINKAYTKSISSAIDVNVNRGIESIKYNGVELVDSSEYAMNEYLFAVGKWGSSIKRQSFDNAVSRNAESGCLIDIYEMVSKGHLANSITTTVEVNHFNEEIRITNVVDREKSRKKEGVYFAFPFAIDNAKINFDTYFEDCELEKEQLVGSNRNFMTATRYCDVSNDKLGVTVYLEDAPIFKTEKLYHDPIRSGPAKLCGWKTSISKQNTVFSYVMNNYWMTNYKAYQEGEITFSYVLKPHKKYNFEDASRFSIENAQPLIIVEKGEKHYE